MGAPKLSMRTPDPGVDPYVFSDLRDDKKFKGLFERVLSAVEREGYPLDQWARRGEFYEGISSREIPVYGDRRPLPFLRAAFWQLICAVRDQFPDINNLPHGIYSNWKGLVAGGDPSVSSCVRYEWLPRSTAFVLPFGSEGVSDSPLTLFSQPPDDQGNPRASNGYTLKNGILYAVPDGEWVHGPLSAPGSTADQLRAYLAFQNVDRW